MKPTRLQSNAGLTLHVLLKEYAQTQGLGMGTTTLHLDMADTASRKTQNSLKRAWTAIPRLWQRR